MARLLFITSLLLLSAVLLPFVSFTVLAEDASMSSSPPDFPSHWGQPPLRQTRDYVELPNPYGFGSGTLRKWIEEKLAEDNIANGSGTVSTTRSAVDETTQDTNNKLSKAVTSEATQRSRVGV